MAINIYGDPLLGSNPYNPQSLELQREYLNRLEDLQKQPQSLTSSTVTPLWDKIDEEISALTDLQKQNLINSEEYKEASSNVEIILQTIFLSIMKPQVEKSTEGKEALQNQLNVVKKLKKVVIEETNKDMEELRKWKEFSLKNPESTYKDFIENTK